eukprot:3823022-Pyramimonas_sp.AAC.1
MRADDVNWVGQICLGSLRDLVNFGADVVTWQCLDLCVDYTYTFDANICSCRSRGLAFRPDHPRRAAHAG